VIGELDALGGGGAEDVQHDPAHGIGRQLAVPGQLGKGAVAGDPLILPVSLDQVQQRLGRDAALADRVGHGAHDRGLRRAAGVDEVDVGGQFVEQAQP